MAVISNKSRLRVHVKQRPDLERLFPHNKAQEAVAYRKRLQAEGFKSAAIASLDDAFELRIRQKGHPALCMTVSTRQEAELAAAQIESERKRGIFTEYLEGHRVTLATCIRRYLLEVLPMSASAKSLQHETYKLNVMLRKSGNAPVSFAEMAAINPRLHTMDLPTMKSARQQAPCPSHQWLNKGLAAIKPTDIDAYIKHRQKAVGNATIDRELDIIAAIFKVATDKWQISIQKHPMKGVTKPSYRNERNRRLAEGEEDRLMTAALAEDRLQAIDDLAKSLVAQKQSQRDGRTTKYQHLKDLAACRPQAEAIVATLSDEHIRPTFQAFIQFQLGTAARRGETLNLKWVDINFDTRSAYLAETKNGKPRSLLLSADVQEQLLQLQQHPMSDRPFALTEDQLRKAWTRICERAGIEDLHIHDLRHEGISRVADTGAFTLVDLQTFSGHSDMRMLLRYAHLCVKSLAGRLDAALARGSAHQGRRRLGGEGAPSLREIANATVSSEDEPTKAVDAIDERQVAGSDCLPDNVVLFPTRRQAGTAAPSAP